MGSFDLDKFFRDRIKSYSDEMDTDALWDALDLETDKKERRNLLWLIGLIPVIFIAGFSLYYFMYNENPTPSSYITSESNEIAIEGSKQMKTSEKINKEPYQVSSAKTVEDNINTITQDNKNDIVSVDMAIKGSNIAELNESIIAFKTINVLEKINERENINTKEITTELEKKMNQDLIHSISKLIVQQNLKP